MPELRYSIISSPPVPIPAPGKDRRAPLYLEDGIWLPEDSFAEASTVVRVPNFLSLEEIESIHIAAQAVKKRVGVHVRTLPVDLNVLSAIRGPIVRPPWMTTYLQSLGLNRRLLSNLMDKIEAKVIEIDSQNWRVLPDSDRINVRVHEYHEVSPGGALPALRHRDYGSLITADLMLSPTSAFEGGNFQTLEPDGSLTRHTFEQGDMTLFLSHKFHSVTPVTAGHRNVMVMEFWQGAERTCAGRCAQRGGPSGSACPQCGPTFPNGVTAPL